MSGRGTGARGGFRRARALARKGLAQLTDPALRGMPAAARIRVVRAAARARTGDVPAASAALDALEASGADGPEGRVRLALARVHVRAALNAHRTAEALARADRLLAVVGDDAQALRLRAQALRELGRLEDARASAERAAEAGDPEARALVADVEALARTLSGEWVPQIPGSPARFEPVRDRVLHLLDRSLPHTLSGYTIRSAEIVRSQRAIGLDPVVATRLGVPVVSGATSFPPVETIDGVAYHRLLDADVADYNALPRDEYLTRYAARAAELVERLRPEFLHAAATHTNGLVGLALKRRYGLPLVYEVRNFYEDIWAAKRGAGPDADMHGARARAETQCMRGADRVVTLSEGMRARILERGVDPDRVVVVGNAVDAERFSPRPRDEALARALGVAGRPVLGYVSGLRRYEGVDVLLRAVAAMRAAGRDVACLVVGGGDELEPLRALARDLGLAGHAVLTGPVPHERIVEHYPLIDVFVVPRTTDPVASEVTPLKPFEALAMRRPLVVSDLPPLREVIGADERGLAFRPEDPDDLARAAGRLLDDPALAQRLAEAGRRWVEAERSWRANAERYRALYEDLRRSPART